MEKSRSDRKPAHQRLWHSGDIGSIDSDGYLSVFDRKKDVINRGGHKIYATEVENVLLDVDQIAEVAIVAKPCSVFGERVYAFVVTRDAVELDEKPLIEVCAAVQSDYKVPKSFTFLKTPLPRNANGKVLKKDLRKALL